MFLDLIVMKKTLDRLKKVDNLRITQWISCYLCQSPITFGHFHFHKYGIQLSKSCQNLVDSTCRLKEYLLVRNLDSTSQEILNLFYLHKLLLCSLRNSGLRRYFPYYPAENKLTLNYIAKKKKNLKIGIKICIIRSHNTYFTILN